MDESFPRLFEVVGFLMTFALTRPDADQTGIVVGAAVVFCGVWTTCAAATGRGGDPGGDPESGALVVVSFPKPKGGSGFPARVFAILP
jgi:hypothetical protein